MATNYPKKDDRPALPPGSPELQFYPKVAADGKIGVASVDALIREGTADSLMRALRTVEGDVLPLPTAQIQLSTAERINLAQRLLTRKLPLHEYSDRGERDRYQADFSKRLQRIIGEEGIDRAQA